MVFDPQCLIANRLASAFVGTLVSWTGRHWGHLSTHPLDCRRKIALTRFPIAVQASCDCWVLPTSATGLSTRWQFFCLIKKENRRELEVKKSFDFVVQRHAGERESGVSPMRQCRGKERKVLRWDPIKCRICPAQ